MTLFRIARSLTATAARFARAEGGNVAMMFAVMLPVLLTSVGTAIDYSRAASARAAMQAAVDATALMISKEASNLNASQVTSKAQAYFNALYNRPETGSVTFTAAYTANSGNGASVTVTAASSMPTDFMKIAGIPTMPLNVASTTKWGNIRYRVALALDNTGSMDSANKMTELKSAATKLINDFYAMASTNEDVYMSIVPFAQDVNIGTSKKNESWLRWTEWDESNGSCNGSWGWLYQNKTACQNAGRTWSANSHNTWNGCVMDRDQNYDTTNTTPTSSVVGTMIPAQQIGDCPVSMIGMTSVKSKKNDLIDKIDDMNPNGYTNQAIGVFWAWLTHATSGPFPTPAKDSNYVYQDVIILLTDGLNTRNRWYNDQASIDARQATLCSNARTNGIKIFAIQVATDGDPVSLVTKNCTSEPGNPNYFSYITSASQMSVKFDAIFKELSKLRVSS